LVLNAGSGGNTINVQSTAAGTTTTVNAGTGGAIINVGDANNTLQTYGPLTVNGQGGTNSLNINDQGSVLPRVTWNITRDAVSRQSPTISYSHIQAVTVNACRGGNIINVPSTVVSTPVTVNAGPDGDTLNVGQGAPFFEPVLVAVNGAGNTVLNVNAQGWGLGGTLTVTSSAVSLTAGQVVNYSRLQSLVVNTSTYNTAVVNVESTAAGTATTINTGSGDNTVNLSPTARDLTTLAGSLAINFGTSVHNVLNLYDNAAPPVQRDYTVSDTKVTAQTDPALNLTFRFAANTGTVDIWAYPRFFPVYNYTQYITCLFNGAPP
jgi:hypothetical protein